MKTSIRRGASTITLVLVSSTLSLAQTTPVEVSRTSLEDAFVTASDPTTNYGGHLAVGYEPAGDLSSLFRFDFSDIPLDSPILEATLTLRKTFDNATSVPQHTVYLLSEDVSWDEFTVTHNNKPESNLGFGPFSSTAAEGADDQLDLTSLVNFWVNIGLGRYDFIIEGDPTIGTYVTEYEDRSDDNPPQLTVRYLPPPSSVSIPSAPPVNIDGNCAEEEYESSLRLPWIGVDGFPAELALHKAGTDLLVCLSGSNLLNELSFFNVMVDSDLGRESVPENDDYRFLDQGSGEAEAGTGSSSGPWTPTVVAGFSVATTTDGNLRTSEFTIPLKELGIQEFFGLAFEHTYGSSVGGWPTRDVPAKPVEWVEVGTGLFSDGFESGNLTRWQ